MTSFLASPTVRRRHVLHAPLYDAATLVWHTGHVGIEATCYALGSGLSVGGVCAYPNRAWVCGAEHTSRERESDKTAEVPQLLRAYKTLGHPVYGERGSALRAVDFE